MNFFLRINWFTRKCAIFLLLFRTLFHIQTQTYFSPLNTSICHNFDKPKDLSKLTQEKNCISQQSRPITHTWNHLHVWISFLRSNFSLFFLSNHNFFYFTKKNQTLVIDFLLNNLRIVEQISFQWKKNLRIAQKATGTVHIPFDNENYAKTCDNADAVLFFFSLTTDATNTLTAVSVVIPPNCTQLSNTPNMTIKCANGFNWHLHCWHLGKMRTIWIECEWRTKFISITFWNGIFWLDFFLAWIMDALPCDTFFMVEFLLNFVLSSKFEHWLGWKKKKLELKEGKRLKKNKNEKERKRWKTTVNARKRWKSECSALNPMNSVEVMSGKIPKNEVDRSFWLAKRLFSFKR